VSFKDFKIPNRFVGLHAHSGFSTYDGLGYPADHIDFVLENGMDAWALTDHGHGSGLAHAHKHYEKMKKAGRKYRQVYGVEFYFVEDLDEWKRQYENHRARIKAERDAKKIEALATTDVNVDNEDELMSEGHTIENEDESKQGSKGKPEWMRRYHLCVTARNPIGLANLFTLVKRGYKDGFYRFPRIDFKMLKEYGEGLSVTTACVGGIFSGRTFQEFPDLTFDQLGPELLDDPAKKASLMRTLGNLTDRFVDAVGEQNFFYEMQFNKLSAQHMVNRALIDLHDQTGVNLVTTCDSHYPTPNKWEARELYKKLGWMGKEMTPLPVFDELKCELYPKNAEQVWDEFEIGWNNYDFYHGREDLVRDSIERTHDQVWDRYQDMWVDSKAKLPNYAVPQKSHSCYPSPPEETPFQQLALKVKNAMISTGLASKPEYVARVKEELDDIKFLGFENYFLTMHDVFHLAAEKTLFGPARGSGGGSLVNYLLGITQVDPIPYGLLWSRFLGRHRTSWPDIDSDAGDRDALIDAARELFGEDAVIPVSNFNTLKLKSIVKDVAKFYDVPFQEVNALTGPLQSEVEPHARDANTEKSVFVLTHEDCMKYSKKYKDFMEKYPDVEKHVSTLFMEQRSIGRHAGGVLIADERELEQTMPLISVRGELQTPWTEGMNFRNLEDNGFIKFDFLGLTLMKDVENCIKRILRKDSGENPSFLQIRDYFDKHLNCRYVEQDDQKVWENTYHNSSFAPGIFQFTAQGARNFCHQAKPRNIEELAAITAIYRPGPLKANVHVKYVEAGKDIENIQYAHPIIEEVLGPTRGFITFQEQFMTLAVKLAGFSPGESDKMRKTLVKKSLDTIGKKGSERDQLRKQFVEGAERLHGLDPKDMNELFDKIEFFSLYGFNKSHAVAYAIDSYYAAWLYTYHPREWIATVLESENNSPQGLAKAIRESKALGYKFAPADVNYSGDEWTYNKELQALMPPLSSIKGLGDKAMDEILEARPFKNLNDLFYDSDGEWRHSKVNKTCFEALCQIEAFSSLEEFKEGQLDNHRQLLHIISENYEKIRKGRTGEDKLRERLVRIGEQIKEEFDKILRVYEKTKMSDLQEQASQHIFNCSVVDWCYSEHAADLIKGIGHPNHKRQAQLDKCFERLENYYARRDKIADRIESLFSIDSSILGVSHIKDWSRDEKIVLYQQITSAINNALVFPAEVMRRIEKADVKSLCEMVGGDKGVAWGCATEIIKKKTKNGKEFYRIRMMDDQNRTAWLRVWGKFFDWGEERGQKIYYEPQPFSYWLMETEVDPNWGASSAAWKMRKIPLYDD
jgi:DNA polymerase-3 subunit alpha